MHGILKHTGVALFALLLLVALGGCHQSVAGRTQIQTQTLANGVRVIAVHFPGSTNVSIFTYLPMSLASDGPGQAQWSHLVEHLVIQSTIEGNLQIANAETLPDHMRLDFYGSASDWQEGLAHHRRWIQGVPFTSKILEAEKPKVHSECDYAVRNFATHKFAVAAWNQAYRHGRKQVQIKGDVTRAELEQMQRYRDERLAVLDRVTVCVVGGLDANASFPVIAKELRTLKSSAKPAVPVTIAHGNRDATWDLNANHLILTWPIPDFTSEDYPALLAGAQWLMVQFFSDAELKAITGMVLAGPDLRTPERTYFYVSASLKPGAGFEDVREKVQRQVQVLSADEKQLSQVAMLGKQLSFSLTNVPDLATMKAQAPAQMTPGMIEANIGLQMGMYEFRYRERRSELARRLADLKGTDVQWAAQKYLSPEKLAVCAIRPEATTK